MKKCILKFSKKIFLNIHTKTEITVIVPLIAFYLYICKYKYVLYIFMFVINKQQIIIIRMTAQTYSGRTQTLIVENCMLCAVSEKLNPTRD